jgi:hypothetical protein
MRVVSGRSGDLRSPTDLQFFDKEARAQIDKRSIFDLITVRRRGNSEAAASCLY